MKVLIVDDSKMILNVVSEMLKELGHEPFKAENGQIAVDFIKAGTAVELVLLDWNMPVLDGPGFLQSVKDEGLTTGPIVMMTTESKMEKINKAMQLGAKEYITKPFTKEVIEEKIKMVTSDEEF